ncbi:extracellular solute-binding protein [Paenibacillus sp. 1P07SE]|uniref:extracellular solute-binding protein n=1 Tax=Paenibacillus sp. 1P07SE TaxID=3132209 RepID=UPI0039A63914
MKTWIPLVLALALLLSACTGGNTTNEGSQPPESNNGSGANPDTPQPPTEISILTVQQTPEVLPDNNPVLLEIEKRTNTKLDITWVPSNSYTEKLMLTLAANEMAELTYIPDMFDPQVVQMAKDGAFWDISPFIQEHPNLAALPEEIWNNASIHGVHYGVPRLRPLDGGGNMPMVRLDWLEKLGLDVPETMEELYEVAKAFTEQDPDGNNLQDTVGITGDITMIGWVESIFTETNGRWKLKDGGLIPVIFDPAARQALEWLKRGYEEKTITQDFAVLKGTQPRDLLMGNKAGVIGAFMNPQWLFTEAIRKIDPEGDMYPLPYVIGAEGNKFAPQEPGVAGMYAIPRTVPEDKVKKLLAFMDYGIGAEGSDLAIYGIKDVHYIEEDGFKVATEQAATDMVGQNILGVIFGQFEKYQRAFLTGIPKEMYERNVDIIDQRSEISVPNHAYGLISETEIIYGPDLYKRVEDLKTSIIMGKEPMSAWDNMVSQLEADPQMLKMIDEINEAYRNK